MIQNKLIQKRNSFSWPRLSAGRLPAQFARRAAAGLALLLLVLLAAAALLPRPKSAYSPAEVVYGKELQAVQGQAGPDRAPVAPAGAAPKMVISEQFFDFGIVDPRQVISRVFVIANQGQAPLLIYRAYTTCACTTASITTAEIPPGKAALMTLKFDPGLHDLHGTTVRRGVILKTNNPSLPQAEIWIQATVK